MTNLDGFTRAYITAALWAETDDDGEPLDTNYFAEDLDDETLAAMAKDCAQFQAQHRELLEAAYATDHYGDETQAGHDFWLTRNGHGAGFWDRGLGELGEKLAKAARAFGGKDLYVGDDGRVHAL